MEQLNLLLEGFGGALTPMNLLWVLLGCLIGTAVGVLPGLGSSMAVALLLPMTFELQYLLHRGKWHYHLGAGPGVYRVWVENRRYVLKDPISFVPHRKLHPGVTGEIGVERFIKSMPSTSVEACVATHWVFAQDDEAYPAGYNSFLAATEIRIGANYYFDMSRLAKKEPEKLPSSAR